MTERVSIAEAAERLGVSQDTIRRRLKKGELAGEKEPTPQGFVWRIELPGEADEPQAVSEPASPPRSEADERELQLLRERLEELKGERDSWREQAQRAGDAERELRILLRQAQELALPAGATRQDAPGAMEGASQVSQHPPERQSPRGFWDWLRGKR